MTTFDGARTNTYVVAGAVAAVVMGIKNAQNDPLAWAEATHLLVQFKQPTFLKSHAARKLLDSLTPKTEIEDGSADA